MNLINQAKELNLDEIIGRKLMQVCTGLYQIILHFDKNFTVDVVDSIVLKKNDTIISRWDYKNGKKNFLISELLESEIAGFTFFENYLELSFKGNYSLQILSSDGNFESFIIMFNAEYYVFN